MAGVPVMSPSPGLSRVENVQAGERTSHLFRLANRHDALVLGTGDLSELATADRAEAFRGRAGVEIIGPRTVRVKAENFWKAWDAFWYRY